MRSLKNACQGFFQTNTKTWTNFIDELIQRTTRPLETRPSIHWMSSSIKFVSLTVVSSSNGRVRDTTVDWIDIGELVHANTKPLTNHIGVLVHGHDHTLHVQRSVEAMEDVCGLELDIG